MLRNYLAAALRNFMRNKLVGTINIVGLAFGPNGKTLDSSDREGTRIHWDVDLASWRERACQVAHRSLTQEEWQTFLPDVPYAPACSGRDQPQSKGGTP